MHFVMCEAVSVCRPCGLRADGQVPVWVSICATWCCLLRYMLCGPMQPATAAPPSAVLSMCAEALAALRSPSPSYHASAPAHLGGLASARHGIHHHKGGAELHDKEQCRQGSVHAAEVARMQMVE